MEHAIMSEPIRPQFGKYQPRPGYGLRLRDVRDDEGEFTAFLLSAMFLVVGGVIADAFGAWQLATAMIVVAVWLFAGLALWRLLRGK
jgi:hypothetical protein